MPIFKPNDVFFILPSGISLLEKISIGDSDYYVNYFYDANGYIVATLEIGAGTIESNSFRLEKIPGTEDYFVAEFKRHKIVYGKAEFFTHTRTQLVAQAEGYRVFTNDFAGEESEEFYPGDPPVAPKVTQAAVQKSLSPRWNSLQKRPVLGQLIVIRAVNGKTFLGGFNTQSGKYYYFEHTFAVKDQKFQIREVELDTEQLLAWTDSESLNSIH